MGKAVVTKTEVTDDLDGSSLPEDTAPQTITFEGKKYEVFLSARSSERLHAALSGETPLLSSGGTGKSIGTRSRRASSTDTYGFDSKEVRAWAIANDFKQTNGKVVGTKGVIPQSAYDAFKAAQK